MNLLFQILTLLCFFNYEVAHADSKKGFPRINSKDFKQFTNTRDAVGKPLIHIYSSASILKSSKEDTSYLLTSKGIPYVSPASKVSIFPGISTQTRSEYFDFTIWGHLGNYFNQNAEIVELENMVIEIFDTIEIVNKKYEAMNPTSVPTGFNKQYTITADRSNFFSVIPSSKKNIEETPANRPVRRFEEKTEKEEKLDSKKRELLKLRALNAPSQIKLNEAIVSRHSDNLQEELMTMNYSISEELLDTSVQALRQVDTSSNTFVDKIIYFFTEAPGYIRDNPLESFIYLIFIYLFFKVLTMIFLRR